MDFNFSYESYSKIAIRSLRTGALREPLARSKNSSIKVVESDAVITVKSTLCASDEAIMVAQNIDQSDINQLAKNNFRVMNYRDVDIKHLWDKFALQRLSENKGITIVEPEIYITENIGGISFQERLESFYKNWGTESEKTVDPIFDGERFSPIVLANHGWKHMPPMFKNTDEAKASYDYNYYYLINEPVMAEMFINCSTANDVIATKYNSRYMLIWGFNKKEYFPDGLDPAEPLYSNEIDRTVFIDRVKEIQGTPIFTKNDQPCNAALVKLTGRKIYLLTPETNKKELEFDVLADSELFICFQESWEKYLNTLYIGNTITPHISQTLEQVLLRTDPIMKLIIGILKKLATDATSTKGRMLQAYDGSNCMENKEKLPDSSSRSIYEENMTKELPFNTDISNLVSVNPDRSRRTVQSHQMHDGLDNVGNQNGMHDNDSLLKCKGNPYAPHLTSTINWNTPKNSATDGFGADVRSESIKKDQSDVTLPKEPSGNQKTALTTRKAVGKPAKDALYLVEDKQLQSNDSLESDSLESSLSEFRSLYLKLCITKKYIEFYGKVIINGKKNSSPRCVETKNKIEEVELKVKFLTSEIAEIRSTIRSGLGKLVSFLFDRCAIECGKLNDTNKAADVGNIDRTLFVDLNELLGFINETADAVELDSQDKPREVSGGSFCTIL